MLHDSLFFSDFSMQMIHSSQPLYETNVRLNLRRARTRTILLSTNLKSTRVRRSMRVLLQLILNQLSGTAHGFALRPNLNIPEIKTAFEGALEQTVNWFKKTLI